MLPGHEGERTQDFLLDDGDRFPNADAAQFLATIKGLEKATPAPEALKQAVSGVARAVNAALDAVGADSATLDFFGHPRRPPVADAYYSQAPIRYGDHIAKVGVFPVSPEQKALEDARVEMDVIPFHFGYWDNPGRARAANELTLFEWDAVSKQPHFKYGAVRVEKVAAPTATQPEEVELHPDRAGGVGLLGTVAAAAQSVARAIGHAAQAVTGRTPRNHIADYIGPLHLSEERLMKAFDRVKATHPHTPDIGPACTLFAGWSRDAADRLHPFTRTYGERREGEPERLDRALLVGATLGGRLRPAAGPARPLAAGEREPGVCHRAGAGGPCRARRGIARHAAAHPAPERTPAHLPDDAHQASGAADARRAARPAAAGAPAAAAIGLLGLWAGPGCPDRSARRL